MDKQDYGQIPEGVNIRETTYRAGKPKNGWQAIEGWLTEPEALVLYQMAQLAPANGMAVEVGSWLGRSSAVIAQVRPLYCVDDFMTGPERTDGKAFPSDFFSQFKKNTAGLPVIPLKGKSLEMAAQFSLPTAFLFIDGSHDYDSVRADVEAWAPKLISGAVVVFHDVQPNFPGVQRVVSELGPNFKPIMKGGSCLAFRFCPPAVSKKDKKLAVLLGMAGAYSTMIPTQFFVSFLDLIQKSRLDLKRHGITTWQPFFSAAMPIDANRNQLTKQALDWGADYLLFLDVDQTFPPDMIGRMLDRLAADQQIGAVSGMAFKKGPPYPPIFAKFNDALDPQIMASIDPVLHGDLILADVIGMGCVLVPRCIFELTPYPWFLYTVYDKTGEIGVTEDVYFCNRVQQLGFKIVVDSQINSGHIITQVVDVNSWLEYRKRAVPQGQTQEVK
jgi:hypothetical protein